MPLIARQQVVRSWVIRQPQIKAIAYNVLSETIGSVPKVNVIVLINILVRDICKVRQEQLVTANIKNVIVQTTMFGIAHKVNALLVHQNAQIIHLHLNKRYKYVVLQISQIPVGMNVNINKCTTVLAIQAPEEVLPVVVLPVPILAPIGYLILLSPINIQVKQAVAEAIIQNVFQYVEKQFMYVQMEDQSAMTTMFIANMMIELPCVDII